MVTGTASAAVRLRPHAHRGIVTAHPASRHCLHRNLDARIVAILSRQRRLPGPRPVRNDPKDAICSRKLRRVPRAGLVISLGAVPNSQQANRMRGEDSLNIGQASINNSESTITSREPTIIARQHSGQKKSAAIHIGTGSAVDSFRHGTWIRHHQKIIAGIQTDLAPAKDAESRLDGSGG